MSDRPASLLTKTQRRRLENAFDDVEGAKRRRDRQRIRKRVAAGFEDVGYLVTYPDDQLELSLEELDDDAIVGVVADLTLVTERIRTLRDVDEAAVVEAARERIDADGVETPSLARVQLPPNRDEHGAWTGPHADEPSQWRRRADLLLKIGLLLLVPALVLAIVSPALVDGPVGGVPLLLGIVALLSGLSIVGVHGVKNDLVPAVATVLADPVGTIGRLWNRI